MGDSELSKPTAAYGRHTEILRIIEKEMPGRELHRCGFLSLPIDGYVGAHIDEGTYYLTRDRYHLSIQGQYQYFVGDSELNKPTPAYQRQKLSWSLHQDSQFHGVSYY